MYYVYFLFLKDETIYKGSTDNLKRRVGEHKRGKVRSTRNKRPFVVLGYEAYQCQSDAERRERFLKTTEGRRLFRQQYRDILSRLAEEWQSGRMQRTANALTS